MPSLPPGQIETKRFPVVGERVSSPSIAEWRLTIGGLVSEERRLDLAQLLALEHREIRMDIHCVTGWTRFDSRFTGVPLAQLVDPLPDGRFVSFTAFSDRDHHTSLHLDYALNNSWVVHGFEGEPLRPEHGGPVRLVTPGKYFYKSLKWLRSIEVLAHDRLGWWEENSSYHNNADPFVGDQRFTTGSLRPEQLERFLGAGTYDKYRGRAMIGLDLTSWQPATKSLCRLYLKNCDLRRVDLAGADLRASNLSLSDLRHAVLTEADLSGSDLEGADFSGADLRGANLRHTALSATRFDGARVDGALFAGAWGLVEGQHDSLVAQGVSLNGQ